MTLGTLETLPIETNLKLTATPVAEALADMHMPDVVTVASIDSTLSDTRAFCDHYEIPLSQAANCVILDVRLKSGDGGEGGSRILVACVVLATTRIDVNGKVREALNAKKASFAAMENAVAESQMEYGAITPVGLPVSWPLLIDAAVAKSTEPLVIGSGLRSSKLIVQGSFLAGLPNAQIIEGLGRLPE